jgi:acyl-[acyl-carrier-protein]-phospholipid O-acyltransferase/long-chain-fatty-acid--[acyl-carrier-protein] ligase
MESRDVRKTAGLDEHSNPYRAPASAAVAVPATTASTGLFRDQSFWGLNLTQFLGAFNDNLYKQILLLLFVAVPIAGGQTRNLQWLATFMFSIPFIFFSGFAGYLSDRFSKRTVIVGCKIAEIFIMALGGALFYLYSQAGLQWWLVVAMTITLFFMGTHSALFGPSKYGIMPEMLRDRDLPNANGFILMMTFLAIIFGSWLAGGLKEHLNRQLWIAGVVCVLIGMLGTLTSLLMRRVEPAIPDLRFDWSTIWIPRAIRQYFAVDRALLAAVVVSSVFWGTAAVVQMGVNAFGVLQLRVGEQRTSLMVATISIGIVVGSVVAGAMSQQRFNTRVLKSGAWGMAICLGLLAIPASNTQRHLLGYGGSIASLIMLGAFTGMFAVPLQVFMQIRPPKGLKGRMLATQNLLNWIGITFSALLYYGMDRLITAIGWPPSAVFGMTAVIMLLVAVLYRPQSSALGESAAAAAS